MRIVSHGQRWREDLPASPARWLLAPAWIPYRLAVAARNTAYDHGWLTSHPATVPVISLGNLTAGGTGKTPAALRVVAELTRLGRRPAILSRGYRGVDGQNEEAQLAGTTPVICQPDRVRGAAIAIAGGADCLVLDDGFQHRRLQRDLDIVLIDATRPWGRADGGMGAVLPLGYLREGRQGLARAGLLWLSRADLVRPERLVAIRACLPPGIPVVEEQLAEATLQGASGLPGEPAAAWRERRVVLASGIGNPAGFEAVAGRLGLAVVESHRFPDHHHYTASEAMALQRAAEREQAALVITSKDAVKLRHFLPAVWELAVTSTLRDSAPLQQALATALRKDHQ